MRLYSLLFLSILLASQIIWETDMDQAKQKAKKEHKFILLNFSGSDWCGPCIRMHKEVFEKDGFKKFADSNLVLIKADFPRLKKNQLSKEQQKKNDKLADKYNMKGSFPFTVLLNEDGKVIKTWEGYPAESVEKFTAAIKVLTDVHK